MEKPTMNQLLHSMKTVAEKVSEKASVSADEIREKAIQMKEEAISKQEAHKANALEKKRLDDLKKYAPIFKNEIENGELTAERVIRIVNYDARLEEACCKDSIGFYETTDDRKLPTFYTKYVPLLGLSFYPQMSESVFVADPCIAGKFIEIDEYFNYMKQVRVNELTVVAQCLGAKSVNIALKDSSKAAERSAAKGNVQIGAVLGGKADKAVAKKEAQSIDIWASTTFKTSLWNGGPSVPTLLYFRHESDISALIQMVLENKSKVTERTYSMKASSSAGLSLSEAMSICGSLKKIKCNAGASFAKSAETESSAMLEYTIIF